jgi:hypothetical protein
MLAAGDKAELNRALSQVIRVNAQPLSVEEWQQACEQAGLMIQQSKTGEMGLLNPKRVIEDEGLFPSLKIAWKVLTQPAIRERVLEMKNTFNQYRNQLGYIAFYASKEA